jgi:hypothetical protein
LFVDAYIDIDETSHATGNGAPRAGSSPEDVNEYEEKKLPVPVHHRSAAGATPETRNIGGALAAGAAKAAGP